MKVSNLITLLYSYCDTEKDIMMDNGPDDVWTDIRVEPIVDNGNTIGYMLVGFKEPDPKQLRLPFDE